MLDKRFDFSKEEAELVDQWKKEEIYKFTNKKSSDVFSIMMPPPNITGNLHIGHALTFTLQDVLIRFNKKLGKNVLWQPGTDHAGIATEIIVEKKIISEKKKSKNDLGREKFLDEVWKWKEESGGSIVNQLNRLGAAVDWSISRFTMDKGLCESVNEVFVKLYNDGLIYKDKRLINWDPILETAVSDLEVNQKEIKGKLWFIKYRILGTSENIVVATTRPETMFGDSAIAIHPKNKKLKSFVGKEAIIPFTEKSVPIISDIYADPDKGSGAVKITPAHDFNDFKVGKKHNLQITNIFKSNGSLNENAPKEFQNLDRFSARKKIIKKLKDYNQLDKITENQMFIPVGDRTGAIIEPYLTNQWFLDAKKLCVKVKEEIKKGNIKFYPNSWINTFNHWINNIEPWCISRQIWWGHRIPVWYTNTGKMIVARNLIDAEKILKKDYKKNTQITHQESDVLDTWFSSSLWPFSTLGWPNKTELLKRYYPSDVLVTGFDIIFFWVARMIMMGLYFQKKVPFKNIYIHPLVKDEKGEKMSKSKGNVIDPLELIELFGSDALRFTLVNLSTQGRDIKLSNKLVENSRNFVTKLWNVARFSQGKKFSYQENFSPNFSKLLINQWIGFKLHQTQKKVLKNLEHFRFNLVIADLYHFIWNDFCDLYIELSKHYLEDKNNFNEISNNFSYIFKAILNLINPILPFVTEKINKNLNYSSNSLFNERINIEDVKDFEKNKITKFESVIELVKEIRNSIKENKINKGFSLKILSKNKIDWIDSNIPLLKSMFDISEILYVEKKETTLKNIILVSGIEIILVIKSTDSERVVAKKDIIFYEQEIKFFEKKLENKNFVNKAPKKIVELQKKKLADAKKKLELLKENNVQN